MNNAPEQSDPCAHQRQENKRKRQGITDNCSACFSHPTNSSLDNRCNVTKNSSHFLYLLIQIDNASEQSNSCSHQRQENKRKCQGISSDSCAGSLHPSYGSSNDRSNTSKDRCNSYSFHDDLPRLSIILIQYDKIISPTKYLTGSDIKNPGNSWMNQALKSIISCIRCLPCF